MSMRPVGFQLSRDGWDYLFNLDGQGSYAVLEKLHDKSSKSYSKDASSKMTGEWGKIPSNSL